MPGMPGSNGISGIPGVPGSPGRDGIKGAKGNMGTNGETGKTGATGRERPVTMTLLDASTGNNACGKRNQTWTVEISRNVYSRSDMVIQL